MVRVGPELGIEVPHVGAFDELRSQGLLFELYPLAPEGIDAGKLRYGFEEKEKVDLRLGWSSFRMSREQASGPNPEPLEGRFEAPREP